MSEPAPANDPVDEGDQFHPEERQPSESPVTDNNMKFAEYGDILKRESNRDKSWLIGILGLVAFLLIGAVAVFILFR